MKIKKIAVHVYGPIKKFILKPGYFTCIFGENESGKTSIVEALTHVIFRKNPRTLRYGKPEDAVIEIQTDDRSIKLPSRTQYPRIPVGDLAHLMYIQAAESAVFEKETGAHFWDSLKALLSHMDQGMSFAKIDAKVFDAVGLTPRRGEWKEEKQHLLQQETVRLEELKKYLKQMDSIEKKEIELAELITRQQANQRDLDSIEQMKNFTTYKQLVAVYDEFTDLSSRLQTYERYKYEYLDTWQECEAGHKSRQRDRTKLETTQQEITDLKQEIAALHEQEKRVETEGLRSCIMRAEEEIRVPGLMYPGILCGTAALLVALSFLFGFMKIPALILLAFSFVFFVFTLYKRHVMQTLVTEKDTWLMKAQKVFPDSTDLADVAERIETMRDLKIRKETLLQEKSKLTQDLAHAVDQYAGDRELAELRDKTGCAEIADLKTKISEKRKLEKDIGILHGKLAGMLHDKDETAWKRVIETHRRERPDGDIDVTEEETIRNRLKHIRENIDELKSDIKIFRETYEQKFAVESEYDAFVEYNTLSNALAGYDLEKKAALAARDILKQMSIEYDKLLESVIKGDDSLSDHFYFVSGRYTSVDIEKNDFVARDRSGDVFKIDDLSSGARDQLMLCFRIAALRRLYPGESFLILDDAFIFADWERRSRLVALLRKYVADGNQVIYFTSDDHTRDMLGAHGAEIVTI